MQFHISRHPLLIVLNRYFCLPLHTCSHTHTCSHIHTHTHTHTCSHTHTTSAFWLPPSQALWGSLRPTQCLLPYMAYGNHLGWSLAAADVAQVNGRPGVCPHRLEVGLPHQPEWIRLSLTVSISPQSQAPSSLSPVFVYHKSSKIGDRNNLEVSLVSVCVFEFSYMLRRVVWNMSLHFVGLEERTYLLVTW